MPITSALIICQFFNTLNKLDVCNNTSKINQYGAVNHVEIWFKLPRTYNGLALWSPYTVKNIHAIYGTK